jgi:TetR/AcrR family transcriptional regulator
MVNTLKIEPFSTESNILEAAKKVFITHGFDGTSMQQIANEAGINKSLLHYYFRNKEKLFAAVFSFAFQNFVPQIQEILNSGVSVFIKIERIVAEYMDMLLKNEFIPAFILHEINRNPDGIFAIMQGTGLNPEIFIEQFTMEIEKGHIRPVDPRHLIVNLIALCVFPVAARPLMQRILFANDEEAYQQFLHERKNKVAEFIIQSIKA